ncbi:ABC transporter substrate-binding protein, partial [Salmonella enterica subsp. enterica]|nr:ABC transporter substrate-binding protein [Salmonella enterica subsp. enterica serovar Typhimurium]
MIIINKPLLCLLGIVAVVGTFTTVISFESKREVFSEAGAVQIEDDTKQIVSLPSVASRVVSISSADSELLITLGVSPVGVVNSRELPKDVQA